MELPAVQLQYLEQGESSLEEYLEVFLKLAYQSPHPDDSLCLFLYTGLNTATRAQLFGEGPRGSFSAYMEWVLDSCGSALTVGPADDDTSSTPNPVPSPVPPRCEERQFAPTADEENTSAAMLEPMPEGAIELDITPEPERNPI